MTTQWLFAPETRQAPAFNLANTVEFATRFMAEDAEVCELTQRGMGSRGFEPGRYTSQEHDVHAFDVMVAERYLESLGASVEMAR